MQFLSNANNHFFVVEGIDIDLESSDLRDVVFYEDQRKMYAALAKEEGLSSRDVIGKEFLLYKKDGTFVLRFLGTEKVVNILDCQFYRDGALESCFSVEDFISLYSL